MKQRILIYTSIQKSSEYDIFEGTNFEELNSHIQKKHNKQCPNFGNRLWFQGLISEIQDEDNIIEYYDYSMKKEFINSNYDLIIAPMANIFSLHFKDVLESLADKFLDIRIPVYVIACGVQAESYDELNELCKVLKEPATKFIRSIYKTGGEFALRGYFSKEFFDRLGFKTAAVTGCPSLYQLGKEISIKKANVDENDLKVILNGRLQDYKKFLKKHERASFFDQHVFYRELYDVNYLNSKDINTILKKLVVQEGVGTVEWLCQGKIKLIPDMNIWREYIKKEKYNFSLGKRIHGNIMSILAEIPAVIDAKDSRVREMAEFFDIPYVLPEEMSKYTSFYEVFEKCSYQKFNDKFKDRYDSFEKFLVEKGIVKKINTNNQFFYSLETVGVDVKNEKYLDELYKKLHDNYIYWRGYEFVLDSLRMIRGYVK